MAKKSKGLGDTIAKITTAVGIEPCLKCEERKETLNRIFPYKTKVLTEEDYNKLISFKSETGYLKRLIYSDVYFNVTGKRLHVEDSDELWRGYELIFQTLIKEYEQNII